MYTKVTLEVASVREQSSAGALLRAAADPLLDGIHERTTTSASPQGGRPRVRRQVRANHTSRHVALCEGVMGRGVVRRILRVKLGAAAGVPTTLLLLLTACGTPSPSASSPSPAPSTAQDTDTTTASAEPGLILVAIGDSIPYNSPEDCPGCTGFVDQYAESVEKATGEQVTVQNLSQHTGLTLPQLIENLDSYEEQMSAADVILIGIAHNSFELNADAPCGAPIINDAPDWSAVDAECAAASAAQYQPMYETLYSRVQGWRKGKPTIVRTINRYNDWIGLDDAGLTPDQELKTTTMHDAWNTMLCSAAETNDVMCADVYHAFNGPDGTAPAGDLLASDYTHPSQRGNDTITRVLEVQGYAPLG